MKPVGVSKAAMMHFESNYPLVSHHTFGLNATCAKAMKLDSIDLLTELTQHLKSTQMPFWILAQGSNTLFLEDLDGLIIWPVCKGISVFDDETHHATALVKASAAEDWDTFVEFCLNEGLYGLENLSLIPGSVGASPIQNIGAYGVELSRHLHSIRCWDWQRETQVVLQAKACGFGYRTSFFKTHWQNRYLILEVVFRLSRIPKPCLTYEGLTESLGADTHPESIRQAVIELRQAKLPDPKSLPNAGSFFKNPEVSENTFKQLKAKHASIKGFSQVDGFKIPAGWLLESLGFKGQRMGLVGCYEKHALILVNYAKTGGVLMGTELMEFVCLIQKKVFATYGIQLEVEPNLVSQQQLCTLSESV